MPVVDGKSLESLLLGISVFGSGDLKVKDVMTPQDRLLTAKEGASNEEIGNLTNTELKSPIGE